MTKGTIRSLAALAALLALPPAVATAGEEGGGTKGRTELEEALEDLRFRVEGLEKDLRSAKQPAPTVKYLDLSLNGLFAGGGSTATEEQLLDLQGGGHDPHKRGFTVQNVELSALGAVDPYFTGEGHIIFFIDPEGETGVELEELFLKTTSLPAGLQVKAGHYFTEFGRLNPTHPHAWEFADQPVISTRMFGGDGMRAPGARFSWLAPVATPVELTAGVQNANGETVPSFLGVAGEEQVGGHPSLDTAVRSPADLLYSARASVSFDPAPTTVVLLGASGAFGPNGTGGRTRILGGDLTVKWKPLDNDGGFPFLSWQTEVIGRRFAADTVNDPGGFGFVPGRVLHDSGFYTQATWGFRRGWTVGLRAELADGTGGDADLDPLRDRRTRGSAALTWYPSEFSKVRLQVNRDDSESLDKRAVSVWLQVEILLGTHGAHKF
jgi:hypothetical protein